MASALEVHPSGWSQTSSKLLQPQVAWSCPAPSPNDYADLQAISPTHTYGIHAISWVQPMVPEAGREGDTPRHSAPAKRGHGGVWAAWAEFRTAGRAA